MSYNKSITKTMALFSTIAIYSFLMIVPHIQQNNVINTSTIIDSHRPVIVVDAGHGGFDGGAQCNGIDEKEINLKISNKVCTLATLFGFDVVMTRDEDISIHDQANFPARNDKVSDMHKRLSILTSRPNALAISIHLNKYPESYVHGAQIFYAPNATGSDLLAQTIQDSFVALLQPDNTREIKAGSKDLYLLYQNTTNPGVIVECGFISNPDEATLLQNDTYQTNIALTLCHALFTYINPPPITTAT